MSNVKKQSTAIAIVLALAATAGCKRLASLEGVAGAVSAAITGNSAPAAADDDGDADARLGAKLSHYIDCFNQLSRSVHSSEDRYFEWVDEKKGVTGKEHNVYGVYDVQPEYCEQGLDKANTAKPSLPDVESAAASYRSAIDALVPLVRAANKYYDQKDYEDDHFAKGKEMHGPLVAAFAKFDEADKALSAKVTALNDALGARRLAALAKDPARKLQYLVEQSVADAKKLLPVAKVEKLDQLDESKLAAALTAFETSETNLESFVQKNGQEADKVMSLSSAISAEQDLLKASKALLRRKRDKKDFNKEFFAGQNPELVEGHPAQVVDKYNDFIDRVNSLRYPS